MRFCGECGSALGDGATAAPEVAGERALSAEPAAERRLVSVLFADLVGFTTLSEARDSEDVRELLSRYFDTSRTLITRYGGVVEKFIGDAVMAVWGTPVATEDDAERAVRAALDLTAAVSALGEEAGIPALRARAGVLTGEAAVTLGAEGQGMVAGDLVNTAARIQSAAPPGGVFVGEATRRATETAVAYDDAGVHELKGKVGLVQLWRALRVVAGAGGTLKSTGLEAPFVGRDRELRMVKELFHASTDERKAHLVSVTGIAGIGKSRLGWEFYKYFDGLADTVYWHRGRCLSYGEGVTYWALAEMVKMRARIAEDEPADSALEKLRATVAEHAADDEEREWLEPRLAHLLGLEERTTAEREDLFAAWRHFFERLCETYPVVMVFEDVQWADSSLLDFIEDLVERSRNFPLFVVTLGRPELTERRPNWGAGKRNFTSLYLEPLPETAMEALLDGLVPGLPEDVHRKILDRAQGVPLYAVETVRMLLDRGLLQREGSAYHPTGPIDTLEVPETLHALIAARLDGLSGEERHVVQDASVLGKVFYRQGLAAVSGLSEDDLGPLLDSLVRKEILSIQADPRSPDHGQYGFLQDLVKTVAYETLARKERKAKHLAAAAFLVETWGENEGEITEVLASHYLEAFHAAPDAEDANEIRARGVNALTLAGERAASLAASGEAQRYFERAAELAEASDRAELYGRAGDMASRAAHMEAAEAHYEAAVTLFEAAGDIRRAARFSALWSEVDFQRGRIEEAVARLESAFEVLAREEPDEDFAIVAGQLGRFLAFTDRTTLAFERLEQALELAEALRLPEVLAHALNSKSVLLGRAGRTEEGRILVRGALEVALENDLSMVALRSYNNLMYLLEQQDRLGEQLELTEQALALARRIGHRDHEASLLTGTVGTLFQLGRWDEALRWAEQARETGGLESSEFARSGLVELLPLLAHRGAFDEAGKVVDEVSFMSASGDPQMRHIYAANECVLRLMEGRPREALEIAEAVLAAPSGLTATERTIGYCLVTAAEAALAIGEPDRAEHVLGIVAGYSPGQVSPSLRAHESRLRALVAATRGSEDPVEPGFKAAAGLFRELGTPFPLARTLLEHGEWLVEQGRVEQARPLLTEAREIFDGLQATPWLERAGRALGSVPESERATAAGA